MAKQNINLSEVLIEEKEQSYRISSDEVIQPEVGDMITDIIQINYDLECGRFRHIYHQNFHCKIRRHSTKRNLYLFDFKTIV